MKIKITRDTKAPTRGTPGSAGIDFFVPNDYPSETILLNPGESVLIPSGIVADVPDGHALIAFNKSGVATKQGLVVGAAVVDSDYTGEIHINMFNASNQEQDIKRGQKIVQFLLLPVNMTEQIEVVEELPNKDTERGSGGFGSTGL
jgi:dUTP pyrophosphatase